MYPYVSGAAPARLKLKPPERVCDMQALSQTLVASNTSESVRYERGMKLQS